MDPRRCYMKSRELRLNDVLNLANEGNLPPEGTLKSFVLPVLPPDNAPESISDEDSADEDGAGTINNLPGNVLHAETAVNHSSSDNEEEKETEPPRKKMNKEHVPSKKNWIKTDIKSDFPSWSAEDIAIEELKNQNLNPSQYFELFFDEDLLSLISMETNRYASQNNVNLDVTNEEIKCFLGILMLSGYNSTSSRRMYWENASDTHQPLISNAMRRDRFEVIIKHLHFADNTKLNNDDKFAKIRPLIDHLNRKFIQYAPVEEFYSFDESMCEYFGKHGCRQFLHGKPIRFGFQFWCGTTTRGYLVWFEPYQDKSNSNQTGRNDRFGAREDLVMKFADALSKCNPQPYQLCIDDFSTSVKLMTTLKEKSVKATGTIRDDRQEECPLEKRDITKKSMRESFDYRTGVNKEVLICRSNDNSVLNNCSNPGGIEPVGQAPHYSSANKGRVEIQQPHLVKIYNERMGGVDKMDQNISKYRISIRDKKWYSSLVTYLIDIAINNAWQLHKICLGKDALDLLAFRRSVVRFYLERYCNPLQQGPKRRSKRTEESRFDMHAHWVIPQEKQTRCAYCHMKATTRCEKCDKGLHVKCFKLYHIE